MYEKVMEILVYLMQHMQEEHGRVNDIADISQTLIGNGYTEQEVTTAFTWLFERLQSQAEELVDPAQPLEPRSNRVLHTIERLIISPEAHGYLIQLRELGLVDDSQTETIIERAMLTGARHVSLEDMKTIAASVLLDTDTGRWNDQDICGPLNDGTTHLSVN